MKHLLMQKKQLALLCTIFAIMSFAAQSEETNETAPFNLDSLITQSVGGADAVTAINKLTSIKTVGHIKLNGLEGTITSIIVMPNKYYTELRFPDFSLAAGYDGNTAWQRNYNGQYAPLTGYEKEGLLEGIYFESYQYLSTGKVDSSVLYRSEVTLDGRQFHEVGFFPINRLDTVLVYFDVATGKRQMMRSKLDNATTMSYIDKDTVVNSIIFPSVMRVQSTAADLNSEIEIFEIAFNQPTSDSLFTSPTGALVDYRFPEDQSQVVVPFILENGHIVVEATVNGKYKVRFILDSGASTNIFDATLTRDAVLPIVGSLPGKGVSGFTSIDLVRVDSINVAGVVLLEQVGGSFDLVSILSKNSDSLIYKGILGYDFLSRFPFLVDYHARTLTLYNPKTFEAPSGGIAIPFTLTLSIPTVHAQLNSISGDFLIDLGNARGVIVHSFYAQKNNLYATLKNRRTEDGRVGGVGGMLKSETATVEHFQMGGLTVSDLEILLPETSDGVTGSEALAGNIGNEFLQGYLVLLDYSSNRLILYSSAPR